MNALAADDYRHGKPAGYRAHKRAGEAACGPCSDAWARYCKQYRWRTKNGQHPLRVDADEARKLFAEANARGITNGAICVAAGISTSFATKLPNYKTIRAETLTAIRAAVADETLASGYVDADLTRRRIRSLQRQGWDLRTLGTLTDVAIERGKWYRAATVSRKVAAAILTIVDRVGDSTGPSRLAANHATRLGWPTLAAWDDPGTLAWPETGPTPIDRPTSRGAGKNLPRDVLIAEVEYLTSCGVSLSQAARQLDVTVNAIEKARERIRREAS